MQLNLPEVPNKEILDQQVITLLHKFQARDPGTLSRIKPFVEDLTAMTESSARRMIARDYGFSNWNKLIAHARLHSTAQVGQQHDEFASDQIACEFLRLVVLVYSETEYADPKRFMQAAELLNTYPGIRDENIYTAAAIGDVDKINAWIAEDPALINQRGGFHDWTPLMYAAYARLPSHSSLEAGRVLLQHGADANAYYLWGGQYRFTTLTGVFGQGEGGPVKLPEHPDTEEFARLLLSAGADSNDSQAAYNRMFTPDNLCLELLLEYGIAKTDKNNWLLRDEKNPEQEYLHPAATLHYQLCYAIRQGLMDRVELLVSNGVDLNQPEEGESIKRTPLEIALLSRQSAMANYMRGQGAAEPDFDDIDHFYIACFNADEDAARTLLSQNSEIVSATQTRFPGVLAKAVDEESPDALTLMLQLGFDPNAMVYRTALHQAAWKGDIEMLELLIAAGGDTSVRDRNYYSAPIGWALQNEQAATVSFLEACKMDIFTAAGFGLNSVAAKLLAADPDLQEARYLTFRPNHQAYCPYDWCTPMAFAMLMNRPAMVEFFLDRGAGTAVVNEEGQSLQKLMTDWAKQGDHQSIIERLKNLS